MLLPGMYVRCPFDAESKEDPRVFLIGQIINVNEVSETVSVKFHDPFDYQQYYEIYPTRAQEFQMSDVSRCSFYPDGKVKGRSCKTASEL